MPEAKCVKEDRRGMVSSGEFRFQKSDHSVDFKKHLLERISNQSTTENRRLIECHVKAELHFVIYVGLRRISKKILANFQRTQLAWADKKLHFGELS